MKQINDDNFQAEILSTETVLVDFSASWCAPCKRQIPILEQFADTHPDIKVMSLDVDEGIKTAQQFAVRSVPTLILFRDGQIVKKQVGLSSAKSLEEMIKP